MQTRNRRLSSWRAGAAVTLAVLLVLPEAPAYAQRGGGGRGGGGGSRSASRGSVNSVNRNPSGNGGSWSGPRTSGSTTTSRSANSASRVDDRPDPQRRSRRRPTRT